MENEKTFQQMVELLAEIVTAKGPEWTLEFLQGGLAEASGVSPEGDPGAMAGEPPSVRAPRGIGRVRMM